MIHICVYYKLNIISLYLKEKNITNPQASGSMETLFGLCDRVEHVLDTRHLLDTLTPLRHSYMRVPTLLIYIYI